MQTQSTKTENNNLKKKLCVRHVEGDRLWRAVATLGSWLTSLGLLKASYPKLRPMRTQSLEYADPQGHAQIKMKHLFIFLFPFLFFSTSILAQVEVNFPKKDTAALNQSWSKQNIDLSGKWQMEVTQLPWRGEPEFKQGDNGIAIAEIIHDGNEIRGRVICNAQFANNMGTLYYEKEFKGFVNFERQTIMFEDLKVKNYYNDHKRMPTLETCLKIAELDFYIKDGHYYLEGDWAGIGHLSGQECTPGSLQLKKIKPEEEEEILGTMVSFEKLNPKNELVLRGNKTVKKLRKRKVSKGKEVYVKEEYFNIEIYDHKKSDGDIISLNYNGKWILKEHPIDKEKYTVRVLLSEDVEKNFLILYAENLGEVPPNTAAVVVDDGKRRQKFVLNSDLKQSDVLYFNLK